MRHKSWQCGTSCALTGYEQESLYLHITGNAMRQIRRGNATIFFHAVAIFVLAGCSPASTAEEQGREVGVKIDKSIDKAENKIDADLDKVKSELNGAKSDIEQWIDKADKAADAAASEFKK